MRRFCASYVESSLKRGGWNWVKSAKDNIGQPPQIIGSWSLEIPLTKSHQRSGLKSQRILRDSLWNWVKSAKDTIGQREFCKIHIGNCPRPTVSDPQLWNFLKLNICNIYWVHFAQDFFFTNLCPWLNFARFSLVRSQLEPFSVLWVLWSGKAGDPTPGTLFSTTS